jgi:hypothetical protein
VARSKADPLAVPARRPSPAIIPPSRQVTEAASGPTRPASGTAQVRAGGDVRAGSAAEGRSHSDVAVGCMVRSTTASSSADKVSRSTWSRRRAAKAQLASQLASSPPGSESRRG